MADAKASIDETRAEAHRLGVYQVFERPFDLDELRGVVNRLAVGQAAQEDDAWPFATAGRTATSRGPALKVLKRGQRPGIDWHPAYSRGRSHRAAGWGVVGRYRGHRDQSPLDGPNPARTSP
jgi:hypothetical protein